MSDLLSQNLTYFDEYLKAISLGFLIGISNWLNPYINLFIWSIVIEREVQFQAHITNTFRLYINRNRNEN